MKKRIFQSLAISLLVCQTLATTGCGTLRKLWKSDATQAAVARDVQKIAGTDAIAANRARFSAPVYEEADLLASLPTAGDGLPASHSGLVGYHLQLRMFKGPFAVPCRELSMPSSRSRHT